MIKAESVFDVLDTKQAVEAGWETHLSLEVIRGGVLRVDAKRLAVAQFSTVAHETEALLGTVEAGSTKSSSTLAALHFLSAHGGVGLNAQRSEDTGNIVIHHLNVNDGRHAGDRVDDLRKGGDILAVKDKSHASCKGHCTAIAIHFVGARHLTQRVVDTNLLPGFLGVQIHEPNGGTRCELMAVNSDPVHGQGT